MFRIRRIHGDVLPSNKEAVRQVQEMLRGSFPGAPAADSEHVGESLRNPFKKRFRTILFVAENASGKVLGFALVHHAPAIGFCYLDYLVTAQELRGGGYGGALYERVREVAKALNAKGIFFECLPDDPALCPDPNLLKRNAARLRFYERCGARPIVNTRYETPFHAGGTCYPHLVFDSLESDEPLRADFARKVARAILERKYGDRCPPGYVDKVAASFRDDPVQFRPLRYHKPSSLRVQVTPVPEEPIPLVVNDRHAIHHVHDRGYVEAPVRIPSILAALEPSGLFRRVEPREYPEKHIKAVHDPDFVNYLRRACALMPEKKSLYPYVFPLRNKMRPPQDLSVLAGYYCIDTFTPLNGNAFLAAKRAVDCALTAAEQVLAGRRVAYALVRPPGHHAERRSFGGFCYFNNAAIAANYLSQFARVAVLDVDYHHGNGTQDIFYERPDVLTVSIHGHPRFAYPYFTGFEDERGVGAGLGFNFNFPLPEQRDGEQYRRALARALHVIGEFDPDLLVVALGLDPARLDPTGSWSLVAKDFEANGRMIAALDVPILVVQEGGYRTRTVGVNCLSFFQGLVAEPVAQPVPRYRPASTSTQS